MVEVDLDRVVEQVRNYIDSDSVRTPFFVAFNVKLDLVQLRNRLSVCSIIRLSDFCGSEDATLDEDRLVNAVVNSNSKALILLGVGEYCELIDDGSLIKRLFDILPIMTKVVVPLWDGHEELKKICGADPRMWGRRCVCLPCVNKHWRIRVYASGLISEPDAIGFKSILRRLEEGCDGLVTATTSVRLNPTWTVKVDSAYDIYKANHPECTLPRAFFSDTQWKGLLDDERVRSDAFDSIDVCAALYEGVTENRYLQFVMAKTEHFGEWKYNLMTALLSLDPSNAGFWDFYEERKKIVAGFDEEVTAEYVRETRRFGEPERQLRYLTATTSVERYEILHVLAKCTTVPDCLKRVYPLLWEYLKEFQFSGNGFMDVLTSYFAAYKRQKIANRIEPVFAGMVREVAEDRPQFILPSRESILEKLDCGHARLFWVDALGCEWLGYIQAAAERLGMKLRVTPTRAILPTITSMNRGFYDEWKHEKYTPIKSLDKIKHGDFEKDAFTSKNVPSHLPKELDVLDRVMRDIHAWLRSRAGGKAVLTSDHGATRLAVISENCTIWEMPEKGKHGGRCCKVSEFDGDLPPSSTKSDDGVWHVLAGHDRFKGGRVGDVEVHGGATLEEMVVPVIELELLDATVRIELTERKYKITFRDPEILLRAFCTTKLDRATLEFKDERYCVEPDGNDGHYVIRIPKQPTGEYAAEFYDGDTKIGKVTFSVVSGGVSINKMDDFF
ncbi:MAG: BREX-4 system phosphatase PglZ [bacterium]|nr:BREX-4 system phosphatase PglZ [bacterium]